MEKVDLICKKLGNTSCPLDLVNEIDFPQVMHRSRPFHTVRCTTAFFYIRKWNMRVTISVHMTYQYMPCICVCDVAEMGFTSILCDCDARFNWVFRLEPYSVRCGNI